MRQVLGPGALGRPRGIGWIGRWEGGSGWGIHVNPWLIHFKVWQNPLQYCKVISLQLIKKNNNNNKKIKRCYKQLYAYKLDNIDKIVNFFKDICFQNSERKIIDNLNRPICTKKIESIINDLLKQKNTRCSWIHQ